MKPVKGRYVRLLPSVMLVCGGLLVLKASGMVHEAFALDGAPAVADAMAAGPAPAHNDFAGGDTEIASAAEVDVLTSLTRRRGELDARQSQIQVEANMLAATESRVDTKIAQLKSLQNQIAALLAQRDAAQQKQVLSLVKTYSAMKAKDAARIFDSLSEEVLVPVAQEMKSDVLAPVLAAMNPDQAQKLTLKLANKLALPETAQALAPVALPTPGPAANAVQPAIPGAQPAPAPTQTASTAKAPAPVPATPAPAPKTGG
jgi:flagellar motility protein MotE (MotC chaperone)